MGQHKTHFSKKYKKIKTQLLGDIQYFLGIRARTETTSLPFMGAEVKPLGLA
jgi:hypothetical protein